MEIIFYGQVGLTQLPNKDRSLPENRVEALARQLVEEGHTVTVLGTPPYLSSGNFHGIQLQRLPSLNPQQPGGWFYLGLGLVYILLKRPHAIHVHTWRAAALLSWASVFLRGTRVIWTIDKLPTNPIAKRLLKPLAYFLAATLTTPYRSLQYRLLVEYGIRTTYIPDGYHEPVMLPITAARFGLRKEQYCVALVQSPEALRALARAYKATKTRKKLVVVGLPGETVKRLKRHYPLLTAYDLLITSRIRRSLIAHAAAVMIGDTAVSHTVLLEAMHYARPIIALNEPRYQEVLGTAAHYWAGKNEADLSRTLKAMLGNASLRQEKGQAAKSRAQHHFTWPRVLEDYDILYAPHVRAVFVDSISARMPAGETEPRVQYS